MEVRDILASNLRRLRREKKWTQEEFAHRAGIARDYLSKLENSRKEAGLDILPKLADALGVTPAELLTPFPKTKGATKPK
ncbi:MAG: XRE family transcriptional regulator [Rhodospirillaceae bacterium]|nr:MAG: XRE family transcriptional regulator [Rhodospirillaceae bacterium]